MKDIIANILDKMPNLQNVRKKFMTAIFILILSTRGRVNFTNMARVGTHSEKTLRLHFEEPFDFFTFNKLLIKETFSKHVIIAGDCSFIPKSGKSTPNIDKFWNGCASKACRGLEISSLAAVDVEKNTAMPLECEQTPANLEDESRVDFYVRQVVDKKDELKELADYFVYDGAAAKKKFVDGIVDQTELHLISKLRKDADLRYLYEGEYNGNGRPKTYDGKMNCKKIDKSRFELCHMDEDVRVYTAVVNSVRFERNIRIAYVESRKSNAYAILFSTDLELDGSLIYRYYKARFQIEFLFRDAKQHTGLNHCQARSENKLRFHFNASLTAVGLAKAEFLTSESQLRSSFSMADVKTKYFNKLFLDRFFSMSGLDLTCQKVASAYHNLLNFGMIAA
jgi:hypothetical protein